MNQPSALDQPHASAAPTIASGVCHVCFATDVGFAIDLEKASELLAGAADRTQIRERRTPSHLVIEPPPLRFADSVRSLELGRWSTLPGVEITIYDFAGASVAFRIPIAGPLDGLTELSAQIYESRELAAAAKEILEGFLARIGPAIARPDPPRRFEDYVIFQVESFAAPIAPRDLLSDHSALLAAILRSEHGPLSGQEIAEAIGQTSSYRPNDLLVVDWNAAFAVDDDFDAIATVLQFANVELVELRVLDDLLDGLVNRGYEAVATRSVSDALGLGPIRHELRRLARLEMDAAVVFEQVNNALKLFGDEYLARVYRLASRRMHIGDWDASVVRKIQTIDQIYGKINDQQTNRRMELLEWIIILLIAWEVVWAFVR